MFELINWYSASWGLLICAIIEIIIVMYAYGYKNFWDNIEEMGLKVPKFMKYYWLSMWMVITPVVLFFVLIMTFVKYSPAYSPSYTQDNYVFPVGIQFMGWLMALVAVALIIIGVFFQCYNRKKNGKPTDFRSMTSPNEKWASALVSNAVKKPTGLDNQTYVKDEFSYNKYSVDNTY